MRTLFDFYYPQTKAVDAFVEAEELGWSSCLWVAVPVSGFDANKAISERRVRWDSVKNTAMMVGLPVEKVDPFQSLTDFHLQNLSYPKQREAIIWSRANAIQKQLSRRLTAGSGCFGIRTTICCCCSASYLSLLCDSSDDGSKDTEF